MSVNINVIENLLEDQNFFNILKENQIFPFTPSYKETFENPLNFFEKLKIDLKTKEWIIAVFGVQGAGKSSFLNALVIGDYLLPVDADETTCIPTLIRLNKYIDDKVIVNFKNGNFKNIDLSEQALREYVDNNLNSRNEKQVKYVEINLKSPILKEDIVFVDLPGVGSLTRENVEVTFDFIKKAHAGIFILRTVPPITAGEAFFIKSYAIPNLRKLWFVQNRWNDERDDEVEDAKQYNIHVLKDIVRDLKFKNIEISENDIFVINVYKALEGYLKSEQKIIEESGISVFRKNLELSLAQWREDLINDVIQSILSLIEEAIKTIRKRKSDILKDERIIEQEVKEEKQILENYRKEIDSKLNELNIISQEKLNSLLNQVYDYCKDTKELLRKDIYERIHNGIFDGELLTKVYNDLVNERSEELYKKITKLVMEYEYFLLEKINDFSIREIDKKDNHESVHITESLKWEKVLPSVGGILGSGGGALGGAKLGAAIGSSFGPVGTIVGAIIGGFIGGIFGLFLGKKVKSKIESSRIQDAKIEVDKAIEKFYSDSKSLYEYALRNVKKEIFDALKKWRENQEKDFEIKIDRKIELCKMKQEEKELEKKSLTQQEEYLINAKNKISINENYL